MTYRDLADRLDLGYCPGILPTGSYCRLGDHGAGFTEPGVVHLREPTRVDRRDALAFFKLAAIALDPSIEDDVPWRRVYRLYAAVRRLAAMLHMRFPARHWQTDKAFVLAGIAGLSNDIPWRKEAFDWARRPRRRD